MASAMGVGCNLGGFFDVNGHDTSSVTVYPVLQAFAAKGFKSVRIPVTWYPDYLGGACQMDDPKFMSQLTASVKYAASLGLIVMINCQNETWMYNSYNSAKWMMLWKRIAGAFDFLPQGGAVFETLNQPQGVFGDVIRGTQNDAAAVALCQKMNADAYAAIRSVNSTRVVALTVNNMQSVASAAVVYPVMASFPGAGTDPYLMVTFHYYDPWSFCGQDGSNTVYTSQSKPNYAMDMDNVRSMNALSTWKYSLKYSGLGLGITEFGVGDSLASGRRNTDIVRHFYGDVVLGCVGNSIVPMAWNDCSATSWYGLSSLPGEVQPSGAVVWTYGIADMLVASK
jgi:aryl-phospho-beta-D-glucosidase BglC (GH1 family)